MGIDDLDSEELLQEEDKNIVYTRVDEDDNFIDDAKGQKVETKEIETDEVDVLATFLQSNGINPDSIKFEGEDGKLEEKTFSELTLDEQLEILAQSSSPEVELDDADIEIINKLKEDKTTLSDYIELSKQKAIQDYIKNNTEQVVQQPSYEVDDFSDDELYISDLKIKIEDLSDEEAQLALELEKQNPTLFERKMNGLRSEYKKLEDLQKQEIENSKKIQEEKQQLEFENSIKDAVSKNDTIDLGDMELSLSEDDLNDIASIILDEDTNGVRHIAKLLNDPNQLVRMTWFATKGKEALTEISQYYKSKISETASSNYQRGFDDAKSGKSANAAKKVVVKKVVTAAKATDIGNINELD